MIDVNIQVYTRKVMIEDAHILLCFSWYKYKDKIMIHIDHHVIHLSLMKIKEQIKM